MASLASDSFVFNLKTGSKTVMEYSDVEYDIDLPDDIFSERYLRKPPRQFLR